MSCTRRLAQAGYIKCRFGLHIDIVLNSIDLIFHVNNYIHFCTWKHFSTFPPSKSEIIDNCFDRNVLPRIRCVNLQKIEMCNRCINPCINLTAFCHCCKSAFRMVEQLALLRYKFEQNAILQKSARAPRAPLRHLNHFLLSSRLSTR